MGWKSYQVEELSEGSCGTQKNQVTTTIKSLMKPTIIKNACTVLWNVALSGTEKE